MAAHRILRKKGSIDGTFTKSGWSAVTTFLFVEKPLSASAFPCKCQASHFVCRTTADVLYGIACWSVLTLITLHYIQTTWSGLYKKLQRPVSQAAMTIYQYKK